MNRKERTEAMVAADRIRILAPTAERLIALIHAHPDQPRYPSQALNSGGRSSTIMSSVEAAVINPDPLQIRLEQARNHLMRACAELEDLSKVIRSVETAKPEPRTNTVDVCIVCADPCLPRSRWHAGKGPLCVADYHAWLRATARDEQWTHFVRARIEPQTA